MMNVKARELYRILRGEQPGPFPMREFDMSDRARCIDAVLETVTGPEAKRAERYAAIGLDIRRGEALCYPPLHVFRWRFLDRLVNPRAWKGERGARKAARRLRALC